MFLQRERRECEVEKGASDKHKLWTDPGRRISEVTAGIDSKRICSYKRSFRVFVLVINDKLLVLGRYCLFCCTSGVCLDTVMQFIRHQIFSNTN